MIEDVETGYGWTLSAGLVAAFVVVSCITIMTTTLHLCYTAMF